MAHVPNFFPHYETFATVGREISKNFCTFVQPGPSKFKNWEMLEILFSKKKSIHFIFNKHLRSGNYCAVSVSHLRTLILGAGNLRTLISVLRFGKKIPNRSSVVPLDGWKKIFFFKKLQMGHFTLSCCSRVPNTFFRVQSSNKCFRVTKCPKFGNPK